MVQIWLEHTDTEMLFDFRVHPQPCSRIYLPNYRRAPWHLCLPRSNPWRHSSPIHRSTSPSRLNYIIYKKWAGRHWGQQCCDILLMGLSTKRNLMLHVWLQAIGRQSIPPYWGLGFQLCRWGYNTIENMQAAVNRTRIANIPQVLEIPFHSSKRWVIFFII